MGYDWSRAVAASEGLAAPYMSQRSSAPISVAASVLGWILSTYISHRSITICGQSSTVPRSVLACH